MEKTRLIIALFLVLGLGLPAQAQEDMSFDDEAALEDTNYNEDMDYDDVGTQVEIETSTSGTTTIINNPDGSSTTVKSSPMGQESEQALEDAQATAAAAAAPAPVVAETRAEAPRWWPSNIRVIPTAGVSSFTTADEVNFDNFDDGFTAGAFLDFGGGSWVFETGILALQTRGTADAATGAAAFDVDSWGIPLLLKWNMSGNTNSTVFLKAGAMPFQPDGTSGDFDVLGVAGIGAAIPLFRNTALTLEGSYNRLFEDGGELGAYSGVTFLGGLSFGL